MTTIVTFATKDVIVMGSDSLGTTSRDMIDAAKLYSHFDKEGNLKKPKSSFNFWKDIYPNREALPYSHMAHMDKLFQLYKNVGVVTAGLASIGHRTIRSLIQEIASEEKEIECNEAVDRLINKIKPYYEEEYSERPDQPTIELLVGGWNAGNSKPRMYRINFPKLMESQEEGLKTHESTGILFGGQYREIARLMHGTDAENMIEIQNRHETLLRRFVADLKKLNPNQKIKLPKLQVTSRRFHMFGPLDPDNSDNIEWGLSGLKASVGDFSDQNAINCVYWLIDLMIKVQEFGDSMPTVGGDIHIAIIDRKEGFKFLSQESYNLQGYKTPKKGDKNDTSTK